VHVDRTAYPWQIKRFIKPEAKFLFVPIEETNSERPEIEKMDRK
jgi:hypothetical protein